MRTVRIEEHFEPAPVVSMAAVTMALAVLALVFVAFYAMGRASSKVTPARAEAAPTAAAEATVNAVPGALASVAPLETGVVATPVAPKHNQSVQNVAAAPTRSSQATQAVATPPAATENSAGSSPAPVNPTPAPVSAAPPPAPAPAPTPQAAPPPVSTPRSSPSPSRGGGGGGGGSSSGSGSFESSG